MSALLAPPLAGRLRCASCGAAGWGERTHSEDPSSGTITCSGCGRHWLVVEGIPLMTQPVPPLRSHASLLERLDDDLQARSVVQAALGRFDAPLGGLAGILAKIRGEPLEQAFEIPGAPWISLPRFEWPKFTRLRDLAPEGETLVDLGCGYGPSSFPFLESGTVRSVIGVDENLLFLLLFGRYAQERNLPGVALVCHDASRIPLPLREAAADVVAAVSFFNHFACLKNRRELRRFFAELARLTRPGGTLLIDMVPNRHHPFATEVNLSEVISQPRLRQRANRVLHRLPTRWLPGRLTVVALWCAYRLYMAAARRPALDLASFKREVGKAMPEAAMGGLPFRLRSYDRLAEGFSTTELFDEQALYGDGRLARVAGSAFGIPYFVLRSTREAA